MRFSIPAAPTTPSLVGDFDANAKVDFDDFFLFADAFGNTATGDVVKFDLDNDGTVGFDDFFLFADAFGTTVAGKRLAAGKPVTPSSSNLDRLINMAQASTDWRTMIERLLPRELNALFYAQLESRLPQAFALAQNFPNPFNPATTISFSLPENTAVEISIYNLAGQSIKTLAASTLPAGIHQLSWDGTDEHGKAVASGIYVCVLRAGKVVLYNKMTLLR